MKQYTIMRRSFDCSLVSTRGNIATDTDGAASWCSIVSVIENSSEPPTSWPVRQETIEPSHDQNIAGSNRFKGQLTPVRLVARYLLGEHLGELRRGLSLSQGVTLSATRQFRGLRPPGQNYGEASIDDEVSLAALTVSDQTYAAR